MSLPPTMRQLVDRVEALEDQHDPRVVVVVEQVKDAVGIDPTAIVIVDGVPEADPDYQPTDRYTAVLGPQDVPVVDRSAVVEESLNRPRGVRHALSENLTWWKPRWP